MSRKTSLKDALANIKQASDDAQAKADEEQAEERRRQEERAQYEAQVSGCMTTIVKPLLEHVLAHLRESHLDPGDEEYPAFSAGKTQMEPLAGIKFRHPRDKHVDAQCNRTVHLLFVRIKRNREAEEFGFYATPGATPGSEATHEQGYLSNRHWIGAMTPEKAEEAMAEVLDCIVRDKAARR